MDISVLVSWKTAARPFGWTIGLCPYCNAVTAGRIDELFLRIAVYFVPVWSSPAGHQCKCDLCDRLLAEYLPEKRLSLNEWNHSLGLPEIAARLGLPPPPEPAETDAIINSLLSSLSDSTTLNALDISFGLTTGAIVGAFTGAGLGYTILPQYLPQMDLLGCVFVGIFAGLAVGGVIGASTSAVVRRSTLPYQKIKAAAENYTLDAVRLVQIAQNYPSRIRSAAARARDELALNPTIHR